MASRRSSPDDFLKQFAKDIGAPDWLEVFLGQFATAWAREAGLVPKVIARGRIEEEDRLLVARILDDAGLGFLTAERRDQAHKLLRRYAAEWVDEAGLTRTTPTVSAKAEDRQLVAKLLREGIDEFRQIPEYTPLRRDREDSLRSRPTGEQLDRQLIASGRYTEDPTASPALQRPPIFEQPPSEHRPTAGWSDQGPVTRVAEAINRLLVSDGGQTEAVPVPEETVPEETRAEAQARVSATTGSVREEDEKITRGNLQTPAQDVVTVLRGTVLSMYPGESRQNQDKIAKRCAGYAGNFLLKEMLEKPVGLDDAIGNCLQEAFNWLLEFDTDFINSRLIQEGSIRDKESSRGQPTSDQLSAMSTAMKADGGANQFNYHVWAAENGINPGDPAFATLENMWRAQQVIDKSNSPAPMNLFQRRNARNLELINQELAIRLAHGGVTPQELAAYEREIVEFDLQLQHDRAILATRKNELAETVRAHRSAELLRAQEELGRRAGRLVPAEDIGKPLPGYGARGPVAGIAATLGVEYEPKVIQGEPLDPALLQLARGEEEVAS
jgi:hypothetical protein